MYLTVNGLGQILLERLNLLPQLLAEERFNFQKCIATFVYDHDIPSDLIINLDQTPLSYVSWENLI